MHPYGSRAKPWWRPGGKASRSSKDYLFSLKSLIFHENIPSTTCDETNSTFFSKILPKFELEVNFSVKSYASLTCEDPAYLQITFHTYPT